MQIWIAVMHISELENLDTIEIESEIQSLYQKSYENDQHFHIITCHAHRNFHAFK